jgi:hypothetical protein
MICRFLAACRGKRRIAEIMQAIEKKPNGKK